MNKKNDALLTVVIPTYNRADLLRHTLSLMEEQIKRNSDDVRLIICDNVCTDNTKEVVDDVKRSGLDVQYVKYSEHVPVGKSIVRSVENVSSKYFVVWGDDDIPSPMMLDVIISTLKKYPEVGMLTFNRMNATTDSASSVSMRSMYVFKPHFNHYIHYYESSQEYAEDHFSEMDFISINVVSTDCWKKGLKIYTDEHYGFQFIAPILYGTMGKACIYLEYPLCIKRNPPVNGFSYAKYWPLYAFVGKPRILKDLEVYGVVRSASDIFQKDVYNSRDGYIANMITFCYPNKEIYMPYIDEMISYQTDKVRMFLTKAIKWPMFFKKVLKRLYRIAHKFNIV